MSLVLLLAAAAVLGGVVVAALGRGGEIARFPADFPSFQDLGLSPADVVALRPPMSLWGYHAAAVDEAMEVIARSIAVREAQLAALRREIADLRASRSEPTWDSAGHDG